MKILDLISRFNSDLVLVKNREGCYTVEALIKLAETYSSYLVNKNIVINTEDPVNALCWIIAADGVAKSITLLPSSLEYDALKSILEKVQCNLFLLKKREDSSCFLGINQISDFSDLTKMERVPNPVSNNTVWNLATSGTTGPPKLVSHSLLSLIGSISKVGKTNNPEHRWGLLYDYRRFAGMQVILQALSEGSQLIAPPYSDSWQEKITYLKLAKCTHLSGTPSMWRAIVMNPEAINLPLRQVTLGGEIVDERILEILKKVYHDARITHIYASTEIGVGFSVKDGRSGFPISYLDSYSDEIFLRIENGTLRIKKLGNKNRIYDSLLDVDDSSEWKDTEDSVEIIGDRVYFIGRKNGVINIGGNKVHPEEIERFLLEIPEIFSARVFPKKSSIVGSIVTAEILAQSEINETVLQKKIHNFFTEKKIEKYKIPAIIKLVNNIEMNPSGKINRKGS